MKMRQKATIINNENCVRATYKLASIVCFCDETKLYRNRTHCVIMDFHWKFIQIRCYFTQSIINIWHWQIIFQIFHDKTADLVNSTHTQNGNYVKHLKCSMFWRSSEVCGYFLVLIRRIFGLHGLEILARQIQYDSVMHCLQCLLAAQFHFAVRSHAIALLLPHVYCIQVVFLIILQPLIRTRKRIKRNILMEAVASDWNRENFFPNSNALYSLLIFINS